MKYTKDNSRTIAVRLTIEEHEMLLEVAGAGKVSEYIRSKVFAPKEEPKVKSLKHAFDALGNHIGEDVPRENSPD